MNTKYTPGPWLISKCSCGHSRCKDYWVSSGSFCQGSGFSEADALLISAAPDLLEACGEAIEAIADGDAQSAINALRAAIAKALGEQQ